MHYILPFVLLTVTAFTDVRSQDGKLSCSGSKPLINETVIGRWPSVENPGISNDGRYCFYTIRNEPVDSFTLVLQSTNGSWSMKIAGGYGARITNDSRKIFFISGANDLYMLNAGSSQPQHVQQVTSFKLFRQDNTEFLLYHKNRDGELVLANNADQVIHCFQNVIRYEVSTNGRSIAIVSAPGNSKGHTIHLYSIIERVEKNIYEGKKTEDLIFNKEGTQLAFTVNESCNQGNTKGIFIQGGKMEKATCITDRSFDELNESLEIAQLRSFSSDGKRMFVGLKKTQISKPDSDAVLVDVWSYMDTKLQSAQLKELETEQNNTYVAVIDIASKRIIQLQTENEEIVFGEGAADTIAIINKTFGGEKTEWNWNKTSGSYFYLISTVNGNRTRLPVKYPLISPGGKYIIGTNDVIHGISNSISGYELSSGRLLDLTQYLSIPDNDQKSFEWNSIRHRGFNYWGWIKNDEGIIVNDKFDLWQLDPSGKHSPVCLTNGYGRKNNIEFRLPVTDMVVYNNKQEVIVTAFNLNTKENGFYTIIMGTGRTPQPLTMGDYAYLSLSHYFGMVPIRAGDAAAYIVQRESALEFPNYFFTKDFKTFKRLSDVFPEKNYNWYTSQLLTFDTSKGQAVKGILYKPENFDSTKKYPVIIHFYEDMTDRLNKYFKPEGVSDNLDIPWFASRGYIIFTPDMHYEIGKPGESALNTIVTAADYLKRNYHWIDPEKIGLQGHSWGAYQVNYIISHTNTFAAAMSSSGISDFISDYNAVASGQGFSKQYFYETHQSRIGATLWERPDLFIENSPVLNASQISTPLLMMNNKEDGIVSFAQGVELFTALRRLGKRVWMLQYDNEGHSISNSNKSAIIQHTKRLTQFFDHYLKGAPAPVWMLYGIPAKDKGVNDGLNLVYEKDVNGNWLTPGPGLEQMPTKVNSNDSTPSYSK